MSHLVLYRNFRPLSFDEVIGQDHIIKTLKNQVENNSFGHAYLFCGTRGTGKTSTAKIFARAVNCLNPINGNPCGKCEACLSNLNGGNLDIIEIDAASNNRVDEIRDLREKIGYLPSVNKYKVYIVDEVHMLTDSAFNALLKTLEEPPSHALFILATTEPHKLPATILSRCMRFDFKLVSEQDLASHLKYVFDKSNIKCDAESLKLIAQAGEGSVRDTLSVAEMCSAYSNNNITYEKCLECLGITDSSTVLNLLTNIVNKDAKSLLELLNNLKQQGKNFGVLIKDVITALNNLLSIKLSSSMQNSLPNALVVEYKKLSDKIESQRLVDCLNTLTELDYKLKLASSTEALVETTLLTIIFNNSEIDRLNKRLDELEKKTLDNNISQKKTNSLDNDQKIINDTNLNSENIIDNEIDKKSQNINLQNTYKSQGNSQLVEINSHNIGQVNFDQPINENSNLQAKKIFGELLLSLRKKSNFLLYSMLGDVKNITLNNNTLILEAESSTINSLNENLNILKQEVSNISPNLLIELKLINLNKLKTTEEFLKEKFEKITIK